METLLKSLIDAGAYVQSLTIEDSPITLEQAQALETAGLIQIRSARNLKTVRHEYTDDQGRVYVEVEKVWSKGPVEHGIIEILEDTDPSGEW